MGLKRQGQKLLPSSPDRHQSFQELGGFTLDDLILVDAAGSKQVRLKVGDDFYPVQIARIAAIQSIARATNGQDVIVERVAHPMSRCG